MKKGFSRLLVTVGTPLLLWLSAHGADPQQQPYRMGKAFASPTKTNLLNNDIAFMSVWGSRPKANNLQGFKRAVLYNARGEVVQQIEIGRDSVYSLDKMIQGNKSRGPLFIRMYRR